MYVVDRHSKPILALIHMLALISASYKHRNRHPHFMQEYKTMYKRSLDHNSEFWKEQAHKTLDWIRPFDQVMSGYVSLPR